MGEFDTLLAAQKQNPLQAGQNIDYGFGTRSDGTFKGKGFFGELKRPDGMVSTELSTEDPIDNSGKPVLHPLLVPTLNQAEIDALLSGEKIPRKVEDAIYEKAAAHARARIKAKKNPFATHGEQPLEGK